MKIVPVALLCLLPAPYSARADWQYTKWGMSPDEVVAASKGQVSKITGSNDGILARGTYRLPSGSTLEASFNFKSGKLSSVSLDTKVETVVGEMRVILMQTYGSPIFTETTTSPCRSDMKEWKSDKANLLIRFSLFSCGADNKIYNLSYYPTFSPGEGGL